MEITPQIARRFLLANRRLKSVEKASKIVGLSILQGRAILRANRRVRLKLPAPRARTRVRTPQQLNIKPANDSCGECGYHLDHCRC